MIWFTDLANFDVIFLSSASERACGILHGVGGSFYLTVLYLLCEYISPSAIFSSLEGNVKSIASTYRFEGPKICQLRSKSCRHYSAYNVIPDNFNLEGFGPSHQGLLLRMFLEI